MPTMNRRVFLKVAGVTGAALLTGCRVGGEASPPAPTAAAGGGGSAGSLLPAPTEIVITPTGSLYVQSYSGIPDVMADTWKLYVHGMVQQERTLTLGDVRQFPKVEATRTLECIGNPVGGSLIGNVTWGGFEAAALWDEVGILPQATRARFEAEDDYQTSVELKWLTQPGTLLVYELNGEPLPPEHGYPVRILMPGLYGQKMPKWIREIEFISYDHRGYWETRGWSDVASVQTNSIIKQPRGLEQLAPGSVPVFGVAFAGLRRITEVDVRIGDGNWMPAELVQADSPLEWTQWSFDWDAPPGRTKIAVRARDDTGFVQTTEGDSILSSSYPAGTDDIHAVVVSVS
jgi:DMSO/TMAO reductase YedYZ molybdopterin-dependent catalytic subunit